MGMGFSQRLEVRLKQDIRLTQKQKFQIQQHALTIRSELIQSLRDEKYSPRGDCPKCFRKMTPAEIINGFNQDPNDFETTCSGCGKRFAPKLVCFSNETEISLPFYCDIQTLSQLAGKESLTPEQIAREHPAVYRSSIVHHGGIRQAFKQAGISYGFKETNDWKNKINPFLGRLPDTIIAECADVPVSAIRTIRKKLNIPRYSKRNALSEAESEAGE